MRKLLILVTVLLIVIPFITACRLRDQEPQLSVQNEVYNLPVTREVYRGSATE